MQALAPRLVVWSAGEMNDDEKRYTTATIKSHNDTETPNPIPFYLLHASALAAIFTGVHAADLWLCLGLYLLRMFVVPLLGIVIVPVP